MHPEPPAGKEHWVPGDNGKMHVPGPNAVAQCGHDTSTPPVHYRQINLDDGAESEWRSENVCLDCLEAINA